jgi:hypothetical protein
MSPDTLFDLSSRFAIVGWLALALSPLAPRLTQLIGGVFIPVTLSAGYAALILVNWAGAPGGFDSLANVMLLFDTPMIALAGWVHYLAFDLLVGAWQARTARQEGLPHLILLPCLALTLLFGPMGLILFLGIRLARSLASPQPKEV